MQLQDNDNTKLQNVGKQGHPNTLAIRGSLLRATSPQICIVDDKLDFVVLSESFIIQDKISHSNESERCFCRFLFAYRLPTSKIEMDLQNAVHCLLFWMALV